jgi:ribosomal-protein-serine acetyltransferase
MFRRSPAPGIEIRQFEPLDAETVFAAVERNRAYLREWLPWVDLTHSVPDVLDFIVKSRAQFHDNQGPSCGIWIDGELAGSVGCHPIDWSNRQVSIGYWIEERHRGKGVITKCCVALIEYLFGLGMHRVVIQCGIGNRKSCAVAGRLGFVCEGILRQAQWVNDRWVDLEVWSVLEDEWRAK